MLINLWRGFEERCQTLGSNALRTWCRKNFLNYLRLCEWRDARRQLTLICRELKLPFGNPVKNEKRKPELRKDKVSLSANGECELSEIDYAAVHKSILAGLLSQIGQKTEEGDYLGARQRRFWIHPSSVIARKRPQWIMTVELMETSKLFARMVAKIEPDWLEPLAGHLVKINHFEPHWEKRRGQVVAFERVTLYGLIIIGRRSVHYGPIDPPVARELFIREGLVRGEINSRAQCLTANRQLLERLDELEAKARRRDILADEETLFAYYDACLPANIYQTASFEKWYTCGRQNDPSLLLMREEDALACEASEVNAVQYPNTLCLGDLQLPLSYQFKPGHPRDGVTVRVPAPLLPQLPFERIDWLVPGLLYDKAVALVRNLPKTIRRNFVPVPDFVRAVLERISFGEGSLSEGLERELQRMTRTRVAKEAWEEATNQLDAHLRMNIEVVDAQGKFLGEGRDLAELIARFAEVGQAALAVPQACKEQGPVDTKTFASIVEKTRQKVAGLSMTVYPALVDAQDEEIKEGRFSTQAEADFQHRRALQRLLLQQLAEPAKYLRGKLPGQTEMGLLYRELGRIEALLEDILLTSLDSCVLQGESLPRDGVALIALAERKRGTWDEHAEHLACLVLKILKFWYDLRKRFKGKVDLAMTVPLNDVKGQLANLVYPGFVRDTPLEWLKEYPRYLRAVEQRLDKVAGQIQRDRMWSAELGELWEQYQMRLAKHSQESKRDTALQLYRWMLEEYRVSLFAQQLGTKLPVSDKRLNKQWSQVEG